MTERKSGFECEPMRMVQFGETRACWGGNEMGGFADFQAVVRGFETAGHIVSAVITPCARLTSTIEACLIKSVSII